MILKLWCDIQKIKVTSYGYAAPQVQYEEKIPRKGYKLFCCLSVRLLTLPWNTKKQSETFEKHLGHHPAQTPRICQREA